MDIQWGFGDSSFEKAIFFPESKGWGGVKQAKVGCLIQRSASEKIDQVSEAGEKTKRHGWVGWQNWGSRSAQRIMKRLIEHVKKLRLYLKQWNGKTLNGFVYGSEILGFAFWIDNWQGKSSVVGK